MNTFHKLCEILKDEFQLETEGFSEETTFSEMGLGSLEMVDAIMRIEEAFQVEISDEDFERFHCLGDVCEYLQR